MNALADRLPLLSTAMVYRAPLGLHKNIGHVLLDLIAELHGGTHPHLFVNDFLVDCDNHRAAAEAEGRSVSNYIEHLITQALKREG